jgi:hypothetical protein
MSGIGDMAAKTLGKKAVLSTGASSVIAPLTVAPMAADATTVRRRFFLVNHNEISALTEQRPLHIPQRPGGCIMDRGFRTTLRPSMYKLDISSQAVTWGSF